jgi:hypothetical protein
MIEIGASNVYAFGEYGLWFLAIERRGAISQYGHSGQRAG